MFFLNTLGFFSLFAFKTHPERICKIVLISGKADQEKDRVHTRHLTEQTFSIGGQLVTFNLAHEIRTDVYSRHETPIAQRRHEELRIADSIKNRLRAAARTYKGARSDI